jgi:hypothetical protein
VFGRSERRMLGIFRENCKVILYECLLLLFKVCVLQSTVAVR